MRVADQRQSIAVSKLENMYCNSNHSMSDDNESDKENCPPSPDTTTGKSLIY